MPKLPEPPFQETPNPNNRFWSMAWFEWFRDIPTRVNEKISVIATGIANHFVKFDANGDLADSGRIVPEGEVVGTTDTQTLTNKTVDALVIIDAPTLDSHATNKLYVDTTIDSQIDSSLESDWEDEIDYWSEYIEGYVLAYYDPNIKDWTIDHVAEELEFVEVDPMVVYKISDIDDAGDPKYFGYLDANGNWYVLKLTSTDARYSKGVTDYAANWGNRAALSYDYYNNTF